MTVGDFRRITDPVVLMACPWLWWLPHPDGWARYVCIGLFVYCVMTSIRIGVAIAMLAQTVGPELEHEWRQRITSYDRRDD